MSSSILNNALKCIVDAQFASSSAKCRKSRNAHYSAYAKKDELILKALQLLKGYNNKKINYSVIRSEDQNGNNSFIVYFDIKMINHLTNKIERHQMSFHCFNKHLYSFLRTGRSTHWHSSERCADVAITIAYNLGYEQCIIDSFRRITDEIKDRY